MNKKPSKVENILNNNPRRTFKPKELARQLGIKRTQYPQFRDEIKAMARAGRIARYKRNQYGAIKRAATLEGDLHVKSQGYGFLITPENQDDVFISQKNMGTAFDGDRVRAQLFAESNRRSREGRVIEVVHRARENFVGTYKKGRQFGFVVPDDVKIHRDIVIPAGSENGAESGHKVVARITTWLDERMNPQGEIQEVIGFTDDPGVDVLAIVKSFDLPTSFPARVENEAKGISADIKPEQLENRLDLRETRCFTIDPADAKDFDDAISIRQLDNANFELGVHIADVSTYVPEGTVIDREARKRGTSVYLVDQVIPMLPEELSNNVCSLRPESDRLTFSCIMEVTPRGDVANYRIAESIIHSKKRFTYEDAQSLVKSKKKNGDWLEEIRLAHKLSQVLLRKRMRLGSLDFDLPEAKVILDEKGIPVRIEKRERLESHRLIEECMLLANQTVTVHINRMKGRHSRIPPFIYRIHEPPDEKKIEDFRKFVKTLGHPLDPNKRVTPKLLSDYLRSIQDEPEANLIEGLMLRSLMKARYDVKNAGHFGLAFKNYTHFTSPIRRYPDLVVHRLLKTYSDGFDFSQAGKFKKRLKSIAEQSSERELVALEAERESVKLKKAEYMARHLGEEFEGRISGVVPFGIFIELDDMLVEGLVHISELGDDYYIHDEAQHKLIGQSFGKTYRLGDRVKVRVVRVDVDERLIDFTLL